MARKHILLYKLVFVEMETLEKQARDHIILNYQMGSLLMGYHFDRERVRYSIR